METIINALLIVSYLIILSLGVWIFFSIIKGQKFNKNLPLILIFSICIIFNTSAKTPPKLLNSSNKVPVTSHRYFKKITPAKFNTGKKYSVSLVKAK